MIINKQLLTKGHFVGGNAIYKKMVEEIQDYAIILMDEKGFIINWNKGAEKIKQYSEKEILGKHFSIFYLKEDLDTNLPQRLLETARTNGKADHEGWRKRKDGSKFWGSITITALHDDDNALIGFCKVTRDLSDKKLAEDRLRLSEERYHQMIAEVQDYAIILLNPDGIIENWNMGAQQIKGYDASEVIGKRFDLFYTEEDRRNQLPDKLLKEARDTGKAVQEGWRVRKDGSKFWGTIVITALHNKDGAIIGFSKVTRDLTQQKLANDQIIAYTAELELQNSELEQFAYVASHDLQEPLRKIQTFAGLIQDNLDDKSFVKIYFEKLDRSAKRMAELVKSLLNYSRLAKDKIHLQQTKINLTDILEEVKQDFELLIEEKKATIISEILPTVMGNRMQFVQLFSNLISNSLKFSKVDPLIKINSSIVTKDEIPDAPESLADRTYHRITFEDNGIGFEQQYHKLIFTLFQRLHAKLDYAGTGIGLSLCKKIVENHGGLITATSELGKGATFIVYLPVQEMPS
jgi:PAS domain S-box-containing protein